MRRTAREIQAHVADALAAISESMRVLVNGKDRVRADAPLVRAELLMECLSLPAPLADCPLCDRAPAPQKGRSA